MDIRVNGMMYYLPKGLNFSLRNGKYYFSCMRSNAKSISEDMKNLPVELTEQGDMFTWQVTVEVTEFSVFC